MHALFRWLALSCVLLCFSTKVAEGASKRGQPFKRVLVPQSPSQRILRRETSPFTLVKRSTFASNEAQAKHTDTLLLRFQLDDQPVSVVLRPTRHLLAADARVRYHSIDPLTGKQSSRTVPLLRSDIRAYEGVVVHEVDVDRWWREEAAGLVRDDIHEDERTRGWARLALTEVEDAWDGAMMIDNQLHHFKPLQAYLRDRSSADPDPPFSALARRGKIGGGTIVMRELDTYAEDLPTAPSCSHDALAFNTDMEENPILKASTQISLQEQAFDFAPLSPGASWLGGLLGHDSLPRSYPQSHASAAKGLRRRQDIAGGLNSTSSFINNIGSTAGCPKDQRVLFIGVAADCTAVQAYGSPDAARRQILAEMNTVSGLYQRTFNVSIGVVEMEVMDASCPSSVDQSAAWNVGCAGSSSNSVDLNTRLSLFSAWRGNKGGADGAGLWHLLTACNTGQEVGVAWLGQLCRVEASTSQGQSTSGTAVTSLTDRTWTVMAHEIGHNFGAVHDCVSGCSGTTQSGQACCPLSANSCNSGSAFIMSPVSTQNVTDFSPCSIGNVCSVLQSTLNTTCLYSPGERSTLSAEQCGNGILEPGEECDPGSGGSTRCCNADTCRFTEGSVCDPSNSGCCEQSCQFSPASRVCRPSVNAECDQAESCTGASAACPEDQHTSDGTDCGADGSGLQCANGICTSRDLQCREQGSSLGVERACSSTSSCLITCQAPGSSGGSCIQLDSNFADGTSCGLAGRCEGGECQQGNWSDAASAWIRQNLQISIPVIVVGSLIILAILYSCIRSCVHRNRRKNTAPSAAYAKRSKPRKGRAAALTPGRASHVTPSASPTYQAPHADMRQSTNSFPPAQYTQAGAPGLPPTYGSGNHSPGGFVPAPPPQAYHEQPQATMQQRYSHQYAAPTHPPPSQSPLGWNASIPPAANRNSASWVDATQYNGRPNV